MLEAERRHLGILRNITPSDVRRIQERVEQVAEHVKEFDHIITTGRSGPISRTLLQSYGTNPNKIIEFGPDINAYVYDVSDKASTLPTTITDEERLSHIEEYMQSSGLIQSAKKSKIIMVDEIAFTGRKLFRYLKLFERIPSLDVFRVAVFATYESRKDFLRRLELSTIFIPLGDNDKQKTDYNVLNALVQLYLGVNDPVQASQRQIDSADVGQLELAIQKTFSVLCQKN